MRGLVLFVVLAGCMSPSDRDPFGGFEGPSGGPACVDSSGCGSDEVCTRTNRCISMNDAINIHVQWTVHGAAPDASLCAPGPDLLIEFKGSGPGDFLGFAPVPCIEGKFSIAPMPRSIHTVELGRTDSADHEEAMIDDTGVAAIDLTF